MYYIIIKSFNLDEHELIILLFSYSIVWKRMNDSFTVNLTLYIIVFVPYCSDSDWLNTMCREVNLIIYF